MAVLVPVLLIACEATVPTTTGPVSTAPPPLTEATEESTETPSLIEQLEPTRTATYMRPSASFSIDVESGSAPLTVYFSNVSDGPITSREWDLGDGTISTEQNPSHVYIIAGAYTGQLTVP